MNKKYLQTLIALAILAGLWGVFTYVGRKKKPTKSKTPASQKIFPVKRDQIVSFTLSPNKGKVIACEFKDKAWQITKPEKLPTDKTTIDGFLNSLTSAAPKEIISNHPTNLKEFGLDPPHTTIEVKTKTHAKEFTLRLGSSTPTANGVYAQVGGQQRVITLASYVKDALEKSLFDFRNKKVVTLAQDNIQRIDVTSKKGSYQLVKNTDGIWDLMLPPPVRADRFTVEGLVDELGSASMHSIVEEHKAHLGRYGFSNPTMTIHVRGADGAQTVVVGKKDGSNYYAMNTAEAPVFTVGNDFLSQFQKKPSDIRSKDLFTFSTFEANKVTVIGPKVHRVFVQHKNSKWEQTEPASMVISASKMQTLLQDLTGLNASSFPKAHPTDLAAYGLAKPQYTFHVVYGSHNKTQTVEISEVHGHVYARRSTDLVPSELPKDSISKLQKDLKAL